MSETMMVALTVAGLGFISSIIVAWLTASLTSKRQEKRLKQEMKLEYSIESVLHKMLNHPKYQTRSLRTISNHVRGFKDENDLRMALLRSGAVVVWEKDGDEFWGLLSRNEDKVK